MQMCLLSLFLTFHTFRDHFVCLAVPSTRGNGDAVLDEESPSESTCRMKSSNCEKCRQDDELRLSTLMRRADTVSKYFIDA